MAAVQQHNSRYASSHNLAIRWADDDTNAARDVANFQTLLERLSLPRAQELVIGKHDKTPVWTIQGAFRNKLSAAKSSPGRSLVTVHYSGHGLLVDGALSFADTVAGERTFSANVTLFYLVASSNYGGYLAETDKVDVLFILDCCYSHMALRGVEVSPRVVEMIAAVDINDPLAFAPPQNTFTSKIISEVVRRQREGHLYIEMADLIQTLRARPNAIKKPTHGITIGNHSICLPLTGLANVDPTTIAPTLRAVFSVHLARNMNKEEVERLANWVKTLPSGMDITLDGVYTAESMIYILSSAYSVYLKIAGIPGYKLVAEVTSHNLVRTLSQPPATGGAGSSPQKGRDKKENIKPMPPKTS
ncbi:uncharacterized protein BO87DRAFT_348660 [Aspergillus neoniger CBS 115656]|uniref:Peptidase C14 caspase domain-containing protein n=1 Tax=Aspergillus neoniger (strain CBS 115656) TaxID=1448310 RepID=A0A318YYD0_ASPNB|nr:hypothetical protein BO87DRAFT_348660 [Aspergillus neoniger CBS 115656]PYH39007.1 hypothetical protein BO87DRAFT_348660 [Aspergillus neoniger CBS 115656]